MKKTIVFVVIIVLLAIICIKLTNHSEVIENNNLTVKEFLADRGIDIRNNPKANVVYPVVLVSDRPLKKTNNQDALYDSGGHIWILFTSKVPNK